MNKKLFLYLQGSLLLLAGIMLVFLQNQPYDSVNSLLLICLIPSAFFGLIAAIKSFRLKIQFFYQEIHTLSLTVFAITLFLFARDFEWLNDITTFFIMFYTFSEITFCNWLFNLPDRIDSKILIVRISLALFCGIGAVVIYSYSAINQNLKLVGFGVIFIAIGINILLFKPVIKNESTV
jgi:hypothetical protein